MPWQDNLRPASFRRVSFHVDTAATSAGRRLARHEYPQRDTPYLEDMGRKAREYRVDAFLIGAEYMADRDALLDAIEEAGAGQLVHPYLGTQRVTVSEFELTESTATGGFAKLAITFVEAGRQQEPKSGTDTQTALTDTIDEGDLAFEADFSEAFSVEDLPEFVASDALENLNSLFEIPGMDLGNLAWIRADPTSLLTSLLPENISAALSDAGALARGVLSLVRKISNPLALFGFSLPLDTITDTASRRAINTNRSALGNLVLAAATSRRISDIAQTGAETVNDARIARTDIVTRTDAVLLDEATGQRTADAMVQLRTDAIAHFAAMTPTLPRLVSVTPQIVRPAVVAAHDFYGDAWFDAAREDELIARNAIRHPGFVPAGYPLQVVA